MRLSICREKKIKYKDGLESKQIGERIRERTSFEIMDYSLDCTEVRSGGGGEGVCYEVEVEVKGVEYSKEEFIETVFRVFDGISGG